jgi:peptidoglycan/LPS O-acetylase OafA/YrhL
VIASNPFGPVGSLELTDLVVQPLFGFGFFVLLNWLIIAEPQLLASRLRAAFTAVGTLGLGSYSMYLLHPIIMRAVQDVISGGGFAGRLITWTVVIAGSWIFYLLVERHFIARARHPQGVAERRPAERPA